MSAGSAVTSIAAVQRHLALSVSVRQMPWSSGQSGTQRARQDLHFANTPTAAIASIATRSISGGHGESAVLWA